MSVDKVRSSPVDKVSSSHYPRYRIRETYITADTAVPPKTAHIVGWFRLGFRLDEVGLT